MTTDGETPAEEATLTLTTLGYVEVSIPGFTHAVIRVPTEASQETLDAAVLTARKLITAVGAAFPHREPEQPQARPQAAPRPAPQQSRPPARQAPPRGPQRPLLREARSLAVFNGDNWPCCPNHNGSDGQPRTMREFEPGKYKCTARLRSGDYCTNEYREGE